ncbi:MAG TPA: molybdenum cofactor biosynthesis protein B, partial [bacterium]|nr:molybdenum cofactor biosynthesis protein B [bacterium]
RQLDNDTSGQTLVQRIETAGHRAHARRMVKDDKYAIRAVVSEWVADSEVQVIISTGGTGLTGRDGTPEAMRPLFDKEIEGFGELFRVLSYADIGTSSLQSRATAGVANGTYIFVLPGSSGACKDGWDKLIQSQLDYRTKPCNMVELMPRLLEK